MTTLSGLSSTVCSLGSNHTCLALPTADACHNRCASARSEGERKVDGVDGRSETSLEAAGKRAALKTEV